MTPYYLSKESPMKITLEDALRAWESWLNEISVQVNPNESAAILTHWVHADGARVPLLPRLLAGRYQQYVRTCQCLVTGNTANE
jgi:hypothetical protein